MLPIVFLQILVYVIHCTAAPTCPIPLELFKLRVWNHPRADPNFNGYSELYLGRMSFGITVDYPGFDVVIYILKLGDILRDD